MPTPASSTTGLPTVSLPGMNTPILSRKRNDPPLTPIDDILSGGFGNGGEREKEKEKEQKQEDEPPKKKRRVALTRVGDLDP